MPADSSFLKTSRPLTAREKTWIRLKFEKSRGGIRKDSRSPIGCLVVALPWLTLILKFHGSDIWIIVMTLASVFSLMSLNWKQKRWHVIGMLQGLVETATVHETHIKSGRCFLLQCNDEDCDEDGVSSKYFFDLGELGIVVTKFQSDFDSLFPYPVDPGQQDVIVTDSWPSVERRFPNSDFTLARYEVNGKFLCSRLRCSGQILTPTRSILVASYDEDDAPDYEPMVIIPKQFDDCLRELLEPLST